MTMRPWLANFEQQIKNALLVASPVPGIRYQVEFDSADLLRATPGERFATYERGIKSGVMCPNEAREREGLSPRDGGDEFSRAWKQEVKSAREKTGMNIGRLRDRITIQTLKQTRAMTGEILETWEDGHTLWASVNMISSKEAISSGAELAIGTVRIWIRYRKDINATSRIKVSTGRWRACTEYHRAAVAGCRQDTP